MGETAGTVKEMLNAFAMDHFGVQANDGAPTSPRGTKALETSFSDMRMANALQYDDAKFYGDFDDDEDEMGYVRVNMGLLDPEEEYYDD